MFLQGAGGALLPIPFLSSLLPRAAWAQSTGVPPRRFVSFVHDSGLGHPSNFFPNLSGNRFSMTKVGRVLSQGAGLPDVHYEALSSFVASTQTSLSPIFGSALNPYLNQINLYKGLDTPYVGLHNANYLGNLGTGGFGLGDYGTQFPTTPASMSFDNLLNRNRRFNPKALAHRNFGHFDFKCSVVVDSSGGYSFAPEVGRTNLQLYNAIFGVNGGNVPETSGQTVTSVDHPRRGLLTSVLDDWRRVMNHPSLSAGDRRALSDATDAFSDVERGLAGSSSTKGICRHRNLSPDTLDYYYNGIIESQMRTTADIISAGIMCEAISTLNFSHTPGVENGNNFHQVWQHRPVLYDQQMANHLGPRIRAFLGRLLGNLSSSIDPANGKNYLYNTLVYYSMEFGPGSHHGACRPVLVAGNGGGGLNTGYYLDYSNRTLNRRPGYFQNNDEYDAPGSPSGEMWIGEIFNRIFVTMAQAMGLQPSDYEDPRLWQFFAGRGDMGVQNQNLTNIGGYGSPGPHIVAPNGANATYYQYYNLSEFKKPLAHPTTSLYTG